MPRRASPSKAPRASVSLSRQDRSLIPGGMATILPHTAQRIRLLEDRLLRTLGRWGYQEIIPPTFEYLDVLSAGLEPDLIEKCFKFADRTTGRILLLRPDVTAQIARIVAMGMVQSPVPMRLCYRTTVFRYEPEHAGREQEIFQVGAELIGADDVATDAEIIGLMVDCLRQLGVPSFRISLGHVGFFKGLLARSGLSADGQKRAEQAAARKDIPRLEEILRQERVGKNPARALLEAPGLYGRDEVLERGRALAGRDRELRAALDRLTRVYRLLSGTGMKDHLLLDLGEFRGFDYYDGIVFDVFAEGIGCELGGGGRYDHLIGRFGRDLPSTGFAFDVDRLFRAMEQIGNGPSRAHADVLLAGPERLAERVLQIAQLLRDAGCRVIQGAVLKPGAEGLAAATEEARQATASTAVLIGAGGLSPDEALVFSSPRAGAWTRKTMKIKDLAAALVTRRTP